MRGTTRFLGWIVAAGAMLLASCGGGSSINPPPGGGGLASTAVLLRDAPPAGTTVITFEITLTSATLNPGSVPLLPAPLRVEVKQFEVESALLALRSVPPGQYDSITVTIANPEMTIMDAAGVREIKPPLNSSSATFNFNPKLNVTADSSLGLLIDFDINASVQNNLSVTPTITASLLPAQGQAQVVEELEDVFGEITAIDSTSSSFTLRESATGLSLNVRTDANTEFKDGLTNFASLKVGQTVEVDLRVQSGGTLLAKKVEMEQAENELEDELEGVLVGLPAANQFQMVLNKKTPLTFPVDVGTVLTVTMDTNTSFRIDNDGVNISGLNFLSSSDLLIGQTVEVEKASGSSNTSPLAKRVTLKKGSISGQVSSAPSGTDFGLGGLSSLFTANSVNNIIVRTTPETNFEDISGLSALTVGRNVSVRGWLFKTSGAPVLVAKKVRGR